MKKRFFQITFIFLSLFCVVSHGAVQDLESQKQTPPPAPKLKKIGVCPLFGNIPITERTRKICEIAGNLLGGDFDQYAEIVEEATVEMEAAIKEDLDSACAAIKNTYENSEQVSEEHEFMKRVNESIDEFTNVIEQCKRHEDGQCQFVLQMIGAHTPFLDRYTMHEKLRLDLTRKVRKWCSDVIPDALTMREPHWKGVQCGFLLQNEILTKKYFSDIVYRSLKIWTKLQISFLKVDFNK